MKISQVDGKQALKMSESEIVQRVLSGETELYELLMRRNNQRLYRVIRGYLIDSAEIEDVMQDTYLRAYEKLSQFKQTAQFSTWLIRIGINHALVRLKTKTTMSNYQERADKVDILNHVDESRTQADSALIQEETARIIEYAIDGLDSKYKSVFILREIEEMSLNEIAESLDLTLSNVKVRLHRARLLLKDKILKSTKQKELFEFGLQKCDRMVDHVIMKLIVQNRAKKN